MKRILTLVAALSICVVCGGLLLGVIDVVPGSAVPDTLAAQLRGGCAGVAYDPPCDVVDYCPYGTCGSSDPDGANYDPGSNMIPFCLNLWGNDCDYGLPLITCGGGGG